MGLKRYFQTAPKTDLIAIRAVAVLFAMSAAVAAWTPENILTQPWAKAYVDFMAGLIPAVARVPEFSPLPGVAQFYFAVMWLTVPVMFGVYIYVFVKAPSYRRDEVFRGARGKIKWAAMIILVPLFLYYGGYINFIGDPPGTRLVRALVSSRFGLGFFGALEFFVVGGAAGGWIMLVVNWRRCLLQDTPDTDQRGAVRSERD